MKTKKGVFTFETWNDNIVKFIRSLDANKALGHDGISVRILKLCATSISKPQQIFLKNY